MLETSASQRDAVTRRSLHFLFLALALGALWFILCRHLSGEWSTNEQYNYGWFVPFFALYIFWLRWQDAPRTWRSEQLSVSGSQPNNHSRITNNAVIGIAAIALLLLLPIRVFEIGNPDWRPLGWIHVAAVAAFSFVILWSIGGKPWVHHFAFPIFFFFVAVPWITPIESPIIQGLMHVIATMTAETANLLGIPAQVQGNVIRVSTGIVGVNEACSGVRSLQTSIMIGLLFGELKRLSIARRIGLVIGAITIALFANFCRTLFLLYVAATQQISAVDRWHDIAGYAIVAVVFVVSLGLAALLGKNRDRESEVRGQRSEIRDQSEASRRRSEVGGRRSEARDQRAEVGNQQSGFLISNFYFLISALVWIFAVEIASEFWYHSHERDLAASGTRWTVRWPESAPGFRESRIDEEIKSALRFDKGGEVQWRLEDDNFSTSCILFFFRWEPGTTSVLRARAHRPDICLPKLGWRQTVDAGVRYYLVGKDLALPFRHFVFVHDVSGERKMFADLFFCMREDKIRTEQKATDFDLNSRRPTDWAPIDRVHVVLNGLRNPGQQLMELAVISPNETSPDDAEARFAKMLKDLIVASR